MATLETQHLRDVFWGDTIKDDGASYAVFATAVHNIRGWVASEWYLHLNAPRRALGSAAGRRGKGGWHFWKPTKNAYNSPFAAVLGLREELE